MTGDDMTVRFACGHTMTIADNPHSAPVCGCGETRIAHVTARPPRFSGVASGPYCEFKNLEPAVVNLAPGGSLTLKPPKD